MEPNFLVIINIKPTLSNVINYYHNSNYKRFVTSTTPKNINDNDKIKNLSKEIDQNQPIIDSEYNSLQQELIRRYTNAMNENIDKKNVLNTFDDDFVKTTGSIKVNLDDHKSTLTPYELTLSTLMSANLHLGHSSTLWNPINSSFIYGIRHGINIINLDYTLIYLRRACKIVKEVSYRGGIIIFMGTRGDEFSKATIKAARFCQQYQISKRWIPGTLTNTQQILGKLIHKKPGDFISKVFKPDLIILLNPLENSIALEETKVCNIPTIGIVDTDFDPRKVTWPIPANDDSVTGIELISGVLSYAAAEGLLKRQQMLKALKQKMEKSKLKPNLRANLLTNVL
nr:1181_t:CDS:2 [Entrophospora candida]